MAALISPNGRFRYWLTRGTPGRRVCFVMLNPSTADAEQDDPTIRRCLGFMESWGFSELLVLNLYGFRATDPKDLKANHYPPGPDNGDHWRELLPTAGLVVCAWGVNAQQHQVDYFRRVAARLEIPLYCLGVTADEQPRHPLYLKADSLPEPWRPSCALYMP